VSSSVRVRERLVDTLCAAGRVRTPAVEAAIRAVPRHLFLPELPIRAAYADQAVAVQRVDGVATSSASQPSMVAIMLEQLAVQPGHRVLEIGAGTGYNAALLTHLVGPAGRVTAIDIDAELVDRAADHLRAAGIEGVELHRADGAFGHPPGAPYDRIVLTVGSSDVRPEWVQQLAPGGRLLLPLTLRGSQVAVALDLGPDGVLRSDSVRSCAFIRLRGAGAGSAGPLPQPVAGLALGPAGDPRDPAAPDLEAVRAALAEPGETTPTDVALGVADLWDGFGLYLALTAPGTCRLLVTETTTPAVLAPLVADVGTLALAGPDGLAAIVAFAPGEAAVRAFGPGGSAQAARLCAALDAWVAAGRPSAAGLRLRVRPRSVAAPPEGDGLASVDTEFCRITVDWPPRPR